MPDDFVLFFTMFAIGIAAGTTGIGGGGLNVPMLMIWSKFNIKEAVPLSHSAVMGNALMMLFFNAPQRHPFCPERPLIHYELALVLMPAMLAGSNLGVITGKIFPATALVILALVLLALTTIKTIFKARHLAHDAQAVKAREVAAQSPMSALGGTRLLSPVSTEHQRGISLQSASSPQVVPANGTDGVQRRVSREWPKIGASGEAPSAEGEHGLPQRTWSGDVVRVGSRPSLTQMSPSSKLPALEDVPAIADEGPGPMRIPWHAVGLMILFSVLFTLDMLASKSDVSGVAMCSTAYWLIQLALYPLAFAGVICGSRSLKTLATWHTERGEGLIEGEIEVTTKTLILYPAATLLVGLVAGLLGLGGGEFMVPLMLEMGLPTRVASSTSGFLMLFTTGSNVIHYFVAGTLQKFLGYSIGMFFVAMSGGLIGLILRDTDYARKNVHLVVYVLAGLLGGGGILLGYRGLFQSEPEWTFKAFCPK